MQSCVEVRRFSSIVKGPRSSSQRMWLRLSTAAFFCSIAKLTILAASSRFSRVHTPSPLLLVTVALLHPGAEGPCCLRFQLYLLYSKDFLLSRYKYSRFIARAQRDHPQNSSKVFRKNLLTLLRERIDRKSKRRSSPEDEEREGLIRAQHSCFCRLQSVCTKGVMELVAAVGPSGAVSSKWRKKPHMGLAMSPSANSMISF